MIDWTTCIIKCSHVYTWKYWIDRCVFLFNAFLFISFWLLSLDSLFICMGSNMSRKTLEGAPKATKLSGRSLSIENRWNWLKTVAVLWNSLKIIESHWKSLKIIVENHWRWFEGGVKVVEGGMKVLESGLKVVGRWPIFFQRCCWKATRSTCEPGWNCVGPLSLEMSELIACRRKTKENKENTETSTIIYLHFLI